MKISERWLREWVDPAVDAPTLAHKLNMAGLECEAAPMPADPPRGVVVGHITALKPHPDADRLRVCEVDVGDGKPRQIVCGAANAAVGLRVPTALPGASLPGSVPIVETELRGVRSAGMLCSAAELGLTEKSEGLLELDPSARIGIPIEEHLKLGDWLLDLDLTPNRGDCLSIAGLAREVAALYGLQYLAPNMRPPVVVVMDACEVEVADTSGCPHYVGRVISKLKTDARTPDWMRERLRRSDIRTIHPLVDITNYVMLELGQPMHAFDCARLNGTVKVRRAQAGEQLALLNEQTIQLSADDLVIADSNGPLALAGVMGGSATGVGEDTTRIFLESAYFDPVTVAASGRRHKLLSDSRYRFERGVDPALQRKALDRATALVLEICGGDPGPITEVGRAASPISIGLRQKRITRLLGHDIPANEAAALLARLEIETRAESAGSWQTRIPTHRPDLRIEADLVEEVGRLYGYDRIPPRASPASLTAHAPPETQRPLDASRDLLVARGYNEIISYSFVDARLQQRLTPQESALALDNPIAENLGVMRTTLWSGLIPAWIHNRQRQRSRARLFEAGHCFRQAADGVEERLCLAGLICGSAQPEQWGTVLREADFFDLKSDVEAVLGHRVDVQVEAADHPALHPGRSARLLRDGQVCGWLGALHPRLCQELDLVETPLLFELNWNCIRVSPLPHYTALSEQPSVRRDLALVVEESIAAQSLVDAALNLGIAILRSVRTFDVYRGPGLERNSKSIALSLIFKDYSSTLTDEKVNAAIREITTHLGGRFGASLRGAGGDECGTDQSGAG